jgi:hypothetical protein
LLDPTLEADAVFEEAIVIASRLATRLDFRMPRHAINEAVCAASDAAA